MIGRIEKGDLPEDHVNGVARLEFLIMSWSVTRLRPAHVVFGTCVIGYLYYLLVRTDAVHFDVASELHFIRALGWLEGWPVDWRGPEAGPSGLHLGPLTYALWAFALGTTGTVFGVMVFKGILAAAASWFAGMIVLRESQGPGAGFWAAPKILKHLGEALCGNDRFS